jgi:hypothetical protein
VFVIGGVSFEEMLSALPFRELARAGGTGLMTTKTSASGVAAQFAAVGNGAIGLGVGTPTLLAKELRRSGLAYCEAAGAGPFSILADPQTPDCLGVSDPSIVVFRAGEYAPVQARDRVIDGLRGGFGSILLNDIPALPDRETMVLVVDPSRSGAMDAVGDEVTPVLMAIGRPSGLFSSSGSTRGLTSDTTRQDGLVANVDVAPTILDFFGIPIPKAMTGNPIRIDGTVDVAHLHELHLDQRRIRLPFQLGLVAFISALGLLTIAALVWVRVRGPVPAWVASGLRFLILCGVALMIPLMAGGLLPRHTYWVVVPFVVVSAVALAAIARLARWPGPMGPFAFLGVTALAFMVVDALFGWRGLRIPLLGGTMFDGARFYGIPNAFLATLLGSSLFVATLLGPWAGTAFLFGAGLFAGFPSLGADLGGSATLFLAAGLWWAFRTRDRSPAARIVAASIIVLGGLAIVVLANRYLPGAPTHIAGFVERTGSGLAGIWHTFTSRLDGAIGQLQDVPAAWIPMLGLVVVLAAALIRPEPVGSGFAVAGLTWRDAIIVLTLAGMAAFFANDTGVAAAAPVFLYAATAMAYPSLLFIRATEMT